MVKGLLNALAAQGPVSGGQGAWVLWMTKKMRYSGYSDHRLSLSALGWQDGAATVEGAVATVTLF